MEISKDTFFAMLIIQIECGCNAFDAKENWKENAFPLVIYKDKIIAEKYDTGFIKQ
jgi:hypothetical protein